MDSPQIKKTFLIFLAIVCIAIVVWVAYLLLTDQTDPIMGGVILAVDIGVLIWNISVLRAYRARKRTIVAVFFVVALIWMTAGAFAGIEPFAGLKTKILDAFGGPTQYDIEILPTEAKTVDDWAIELSGGGWKGDTVIVTLTITNRGERRCFGLCSSLGPGPELIAIDSANGVVEPWVAEPDPIRFLYYYPPYTKQFNASESWTGTLKFEMRPSSEDVGLYITWNYTTNHFLFDLGEPNS